MGGLTKRRFSKLEEAFGGESCLWCQQYYWTRAATNKVIGPFSETAYGNEAGLVVTRELEVLLRPEQDRDPRYLDDLPRYDFGAEHSGVIEAYRRVEESRPPREACSCFEVWSQIRAIEAQVLRYYPRVADRIIEDLTEYAASPPKKPLYHFTGECACR
jgi:hypothetical protein